MEGIQAGVPTFFDNFILKLTANLLAREEIHDWNLAHKTQPGSERHALQMDLQFVDIYLKSHDEGRFVKYAARRALDRARNGIVSDIAELDLVMSQGTDTCLNWKSDPLFKTVYDFTLYPMMLWEIRPAAIIEIGSGLGTSAIWLADMLGVLKIEATIYSVDITPLQKTYPGVRFSAGDCRHPETLIGVEALKAMPHPLLVIEDAHVNVLGVLTYLHPHMRSGDYLIVEDSQPKQETLDGFMSKYGASYRVDARYTDFFGRNATCAANSIFKRV